MKKSTTVTTALLMLQVFVLSCNGQKSISNKDVPIVNTDLKTLKFTVKPADDWSDLFLRKSGWFGADGIFAIPRDGVDTAGAAKNQQTILLFSDTMIGEVINDSTVKPGFAMIHNSVAILKGGEPKKENIEFFWDKKADGSPAAVFTPSTPASKPGEYYWLGDGFVNPSKD